MPRATLTLLIAISLAVALAGCGGAASLEGAIADIPVYPGAVLKDTLAMGLTESTLDGSEPDKETEGVIWDLETSDSAEKVIAFYEKALPAGSKSGGQLGAKGRASQDEGEEEGDRGNITTFNYRPTGWTEEEGVTIEIEPGSPTKITITQSVNKGRS
ncbi:MAG: hypothetical protein HYS13_22050 [Planctomycetia bacterium]|nr:hypothetical protein [Planctomycetia bacterium]